jgi:hypothetical protein
MGQVSKEIFAENPLLFAPRKKNLQTPNKKRNQNQSPEVIQIPRNLKKKALKEPIPCIVNSV